MKITKFIILTVLIINLFISTQLLSEEVFNYNSKNKRDPFVPLVTESGVYVPSLEINIESIADISLEGTMVDPEGNSLAIINGQILKIGDRIGNFKIIKIEAARIILLADDQEYIVNLSSE